MENEGKDGTAGPHGSDAGPIPQGVETKTTDDVRVAPKPDKAKGAKTTVSVTGQPTWAQRVGSKSLKGQAANKNVPPPSQSVANTALTYKPVLDPARNASLRARDGVAELRRVVRTRKSAKEFGYFEEEIVQNLKPRLADVPTAWRVVVTGFISETEHEAKRWTDRLRGKAMSMHPECAVKAIRIQKSTTTLELTHPIILPEDASWDNGRVKTISSTSATPDLILVRFAWIRKQRNLQEAGAQLWDIIGKVPVNSVVDEKGATAIFNGKAEGIKGGRWKVVLRIEKRGEVTIAIGETPDARACYRCGASGHTESVCEKLWSARKSLQHFGVTTTKGDGVVIEDPAKRPSDKPDAKVETSPAGTDPAPGSMGSGDGGDPAQLGTTIEVDASEAEAGVEGVVRKRARSMDGMEHMREHKIFASEQEEDSEGCRNKRRTVVELDSVEAEWTARQVDEHVDKVVKQRRGLNEKKARAEAHRLRWSKRLIGQADKWVLGETLEQGDCGPDAFLRGLVLDNTADNKRSEIEKRLVQKYKLDQMGAITELRALVKDKYEQIRQKTLEKDKKPSESHEAYLRSWTCKWWTELELVSAASILGVSIIVMNAAPLSRIDIMTTNFYKEERERVIVVFGGSAESYPHWHYVKSGCGSERKKTIAEFWKNTGVDIQVVATRDYCSDQEYQRRVSEIAESDRARQAKPTPVSQ